MIDLLFIDDILSRYVNPNLNYVAEEEGQTKQKGKKGTRTQSFNTAAV